MAVDFNPYLYSGWPDTLRKLASKIRKENMTDADANQIELAAAVLEKALEYVFAATPLVQGEERRAQELKNFVDKAPGVYRGVSEAAFSIEEEIFPSLSEDEIATILQRFNPMTEEETQKPRYVPSPRGLHRVVQPAQHQQAQQLQREYDAQRGLTTEEGKLSHKVEMIHREFNSIASILGIIVKMLEEMRGLHRG
jgi:hypothetical protein